MRRKLGIEMQAHPATSDDGEPLLDPTPTKRRGGRGARGAKFGKFDKNEYGIPARPPRLHSYEVEQDDDDDEEDPKDSVRRGGRCGLDGDSETDDPDEQYPTTIRGGSRVLSPASASTYAWSGAIGLALADFGLPIPKRPPPKGPVFVVCIGAALWTVTLTMVFLSIVSFQPHSTGQAAGGGGGGGGDGGSATVMLDEEPLPGLSDLCPCSCQESSANGGVLIRTPVEKLHSIPIMTTPPPPPPMAPPASPVAESPAVPTLAPVPALPHMPHLPSAAASLLPTALQSPAGAGEFAMPPISDGTECLATKEAPIFASVTSWRQIGNLQLDQTVVAAGPPEISDGYLLLPIRPRGAVEVAVLKFPEAKWECHEWDFADQAMPEFELPTQKRLICERDRVDGYEYRYTLLGNSLLAPGCGECQCCRRKKLVGSSPDSAFGRRLSTAEGGLGISWPGESSGDSTTPVTDLIVTTTTQALAFGGGGGIGVGGASPFQAAEPMVSAPAAPALPSSLYPPPPSAPATPSVPSAASSYVPAPAPLPPPAAPPLAFMGGQDKDDDEDPRECRPGDTCAFGQTWCTRFGEQSLEAAGYCRKRTCDGPDGISTFPNHTCDSPSIPTLDFERELADLPNYVREHALSDITWLNWQINSNLAKRGMTDFELYLDDVLTQSATWKLFNTEATWLVGCWPPQRYLVTDGMIHIPAGRITVRLGGVNLVVSVYNLTATFRQLRTDIECHGGWFYLGSVGKDAEGLELTVDRFDATGEVSVQCEMGLTAFCIALMVGRDHLSQEVVKRVPDILLAWLSSTSQMPLGPGCPSALHNVISVMPYSSKECCEDSFAVDRWGCLVGGQFNGRHRSKRDNVSGVQCEPSALDASQWTARCDSIPGNYQNATPGICREADWSYGSDDKHTEDVGSEGYYIAPPKDENWVRMLEGLHYFSNADWFLTLALVWCTCASCCLACNSCAGLNVDREHAAELVRQGLMQASPFLARTISGTGCLTPPSGGQSTRGPRRFSLRGRSHSPADDTTPRRELAFGA